MNKEQKTFRIIGLMSGTSLDGLDIAFCEFEKEKEWSYSILFAETVKYSDQFIEQLSKADQLSGYALMSLDADLGVFFGNQVNEFLNKFNIDKSTVDAIASHGQTIFHQPDKHFTTQIGSGAHIAATTGINTICDFRSLDVALGGQGAPLVPIGDQLLFNQYDYCLNLGGIANISYSDNGIRKSYDIGFANMASNYLSKKLGKSFDKNGEIAKNSLIDMNLYDELNKLSYFHQKPPKSLGKEYFDQVFIPTLNNASLSTDYQLHTIGKHLAYQISKLLKRGSCLVTGGGAYNSFWIDEIKKLTQVEIIVPDKNLIDFKEALIFAFLGLLNLNNEINTLKSVTGASSDSIGGIIFKAV